MSAWPRQPYTRQDSSRLRSYGRKHGVLVTKLSKTDILSIFISLRTDKRACPTLPACQDATPQFRQSDSER